MIALALAGASWAGVTSTAYHFRGSPGISINLPLTLSSDQPVAGINGQVVYDRTLFSNPQITHATNNPNFVALGNDVSSPSEPEVGRYNFVVYADPTATMPLDRASVYLTFAINPVVRQTMTSTLSFDLAAASDPNAVSLTTAFSNILIDLNSTGAKHWTMYE